MFYHFFYLIVLVELASHIDGTLISDRQLESNNFEPAYERDKATPFVVEEQLKNKASNAEEVKK